MLINLPRYWYSRSFHLLTLLLLPFSWLFGAIVSMRRWFYRLGFFKVQRFPVPVIVVGNITVGGTGKTPFVIWLAKFLQSHGYTPGIVSRGVGGSKHTQPYFVKANDCISQVGDEAMLLWQHTHCPVVICIDRAAAVHALLNHVSCDVVISDDGLQHYRLGRDIEIGMVDGVRRFGNSYLLPAGPLREPRRRLQQTDFIVVTGQDVTDNFTMTLSPAYFVSMVDPHNRMNVKDFPYKKIHAVAGIGHPERFFTTLQELGLDMFQHVFKDHYHYQAQDLDFKDELPIVMTEKDAVKCASFADYRYWYVAITAKINSRLEQALLEKINANRIRT